MRRHYIVSASHLEKALDHFNEFHYVILPSGRLFLTGTHPGESERQAWCDLKGTDPLPHLLSKKKISSSHVEELKHLGVTSEDVTFDVIEKIATVHPLLGGD